MLCMMVQLIPESAIQINASSGTEINLNTAAVNSIYLLTKEQFVQTGNVESGQGGYCLTDVGTNEASKTVYIGDGTYNENEYKGNNDIDVELKAVKKSLTLLQINPVSDGNYTTKLTVSETSKIGEVKIKENAKATITLDADLEISKISMGKGSELKINSKGHQLKVAGQITGNGDITLTGKNLDIAGIKADKLTLDQAEITANNKEMTADEQLTVKNSTVKNASLLGYGDDLTGNKTLTFAGSSNQLNNITAVGTSETGKATVTIEGENTITASSDITYYCDYSFTYRNSEKELKKEAAWPASYRVRFQGNMSDNSTIIGYHNSEGTYKVANDITLPEYTEDGYSYVGWKIGNDTVTKLPTSQKGNQTLTVVLKSEKVVVSFDLGYDPGETTNDDYKNLNRVTTDNKEWGEIVKLTTPKRFGYRFAGWKVKSVENGDVYQNQTNYVVSLSDAKKSSNGEYQITLEAQWEAKEFPFRFLISGVDEENIKVQVGDKVFASIADFANAYKDVSWDKNDKLLDFAKITYGETLQAYMDRMGISEMPKLIDKRSGEQKLDFSGWATPGGNIATDDMRFTIGSILDNKTQDETLESYEKTITATPVFLTGQWGTASYTLTTDLVDGWDILIDGEVQKPSALTKLKNTLTGNDTMSIKVKAGSEVTWRCSSSNVQNFSLWNFTEGFLPEETPMVSGAKYISYTTKMPYKDITATKSELTKTYIDISQSPITFEENVKLPSGRSVDGFWYEKEMKAAESDGIQINTMSPAFVGTAKNSGHEGEYFYVWNKNDQFRLTSAGNETMNQLILTNAITVSVRNCKMSATNEYNEKAVGSQIGGAELGNIFTNETGKNIETELITKSVNLKDYANILIDTSKTNAYTVNFNIEDDESQIMDISTDGFHTASQYKGQINLKGSSSRKNKLKLGTVFGDFRVSMNNLEVTSYDKKDIDKAFNYAFYTSYSGLLGFTNCTIDMKERDIYTYDYSITVNSTDFKARNIRLYYNGLLISGTSNVHIYENVYSARHTITLTGSSNAVIDGNVVSTTQDMYASGNINTTGYLIVKGTVFDSANMEFKKGTIICNILEIGSQTTFSDSARIITNMITGNVHNSLKLENGKRVLSNENSNRIGFLVKLSSNEDDYPFITYTPDSVTKRNYTFGGANTKIYLYGYYKTSGNYYDTTIKATDTNNPVNQWISKCMNDDGELKTGLNSATLSDSELQNSIKGYTDSKNKECMILGNSTYTAQTTRPRYAVFSGANIYAAGNLTLFNDTTVSAGNISCNGDFGTKGELTITGGTINAGTVGNVENITTSKADMTKCWKKTQISGGTVKAETIGARSSYATKDTPQRSYVDITAGTIKDGTKVQKDEYVNYIYDKNDFPDGKNNNVSFNNNVRMTTTWTTKLGDWTTEGIQTLPILTDSTGEKGSWTYGTITGSTITGIGTAGQILPESADKEYVQDNDQILLYATKSQYVLTKMYGTSYYSLSVDGESNITFADTTVTDIADMKTKDVQKADIKKGAKIKLTVTDEKYKDRTVVWYKDGNGQYHNALSDAQWEGNSITFSMPNGNSYIYVVDDEHQLPLDLYANGLSFTADGFMTEYASADANGSLNAENKENVFKYSGDYKIVQSNIKEGDITQDSKYDLNITSTKMTANRIRFAKDFDNLEDAQKIYANRIFQKCEDAQFGVVLENGAKVKMQMEGKNTFFRFSVKESSKLNLCGKTGNSTDVLYFLKSVSNIPAYNNVIIGNVENENYGKTGECVIKDLDIRMRSNYAGYLMHGAANGRQGMLTIDHCILNRYTWGDTSSLGINLKDITISNSIFTIPNGSSYTTSLFLDCSNVTIEKGSEIQWSGVGSSSTGGYPIDYGLDGTLTIDDSKVGVTYETRMTEGNMAINEPANKKAKKVILQNNAEVQMDSRAVFNSLDVKSGAKFTVKQNKSEDTYLLCPNVTVDGGTINTDYLIVSGYHHPKDAGTNSYASSKAALDDKIKQKSNMEDGNDTTNQVQNIGLLIKDGIVNASKFVGGDMNGKVTVEGGILNSVQIGTSGKLFGFTRLLPSNETDFVYQYDILDYSNYTQSCNVKIAGGTVNVVENGYLGGMNSKVEVTGGDIKLENQAVLGMTDKQTETLKNHYSAKNDDIASHTDKNCNVNIIGGSVTQADGKGVIGRISAPYGKISVSGQDAKVKIANMSSDYGTVEISKSKNAYDNPYSGNETGKYKSDRIGIWITDTLSAQTIKISDGAQVYAPNAYAEITNGQGGLSVKEAALYSDSYGEKGIVRNSSDKEYNDEPSSEERTVFGTKMVTVSYDLNPNGVVFDSDLAEIQNPNVENYTVTGTSTTIPLKNLTCDGYEFKGWYNDKSCTGDAITSLDQSIQNDLTLYAKWEKLKVKFKIMMDGKSSSEFKDSEFEENSNWKQEEDTYVYTKEPEITYGDKILSVSGANLKDYSTNTMGVTELEIQEDGYQGSKAINAETIVTKELAKYYKENQKDTIVLHVSKVQKRYATITFSLNQKDGKPVDAKFNQTSLGISAMMELEENIGVDQTLGSVTKFADTNVTDTKSPGLIKPSATGYTFIGWNIDPDATRETTNGWVNSQTIFKTSTNVYAIWQANTYKIEFNAGAGKWVTTTSEEPKVDDPEKKKLYYYWMYDTPISEDNSFWIKEENTDKYMSNLPYAWKEGSTFDNADGWNYSYEENGQIISGKIDSTKVLSGIFIKALDVSLGSPEDTPEYTALTLTASYSPVKVTYDLNGGSWTNKDNKDVAEPTYGEALYGYTKGEAVTSEEVVTAVTGENREKYQVRSTTANEFDQNKKFIEADYRNQLSRKGYTFHGWKDENNKEVGTTPRFKDVNLKASWEANTYSLTLNSLSNGDSSYSDFHTGEQTSIASIPVTVGEEINVANWPSRNGDWYAYNKTNASPEDNQKRYLLGFTFQRLDPGTTEQSDTEGYNVYQNYAQTVTNLQNNNTLYQSRVTSGNNVTKGTVFELPKDGSYANDIVGGNQSYEVPDYPNGCNIEMYAVYRERSLVFVERYIDPDGNEQQQIKYSTAWNEWSDYPEKGYGTNGDSKITDQGYSLIGWYVNGTTTAAASYPENKASYDKQKDKFKEAAANLGTYDIMVYTVYVAQVTRSDITLTAKKDPTSEELSTNSYTLPSSMQSGILSLEITTKDQGLKLVSRDEMQNHQYDQTWEDQGTTYTSDDTVAIVARISKGDITKEVDLSEVLNNTKNFDQQVAAGWQLTFTLYHSKVMTKESNYQINVKAKFLSKDTDLENQWIQNKIQVKLQPSQYKVRYQIHLPEETGKLSMTETEDFKKPTDENADTITKEVTLGYGSTLSDKLPVIEGYTVADGWKYADSDHSYQKLIMTVNAQNKGVIDLTRGYKANTYQLSADNQTLSDWDITYSDGAKDFTETSLSTDEKAVKYHSLITFTPRSTQAGNFPEYITLTLGSGEEKKVKLSEYESATKNETTGAYTFRMPAESMAACYVTKETMYLEEGTISITEDGYTQEKATGTVTKKWPGDYVILQNKDNNAATTTNHQLILGGNLSKKKIQIGNLNINTKDSIKLDVNTNAKITMGDSTSVSHLIAKNIKVPQTAQFSCEPETGNQNKAIVALSPDRKVAAIGDIEGNGMIMLDRLNISAVMPTSSKASVIGSDGEAQSSGKNIKLTNSNLIVEEKSDTVTYQGTWIGGKDVTNVTINNTTINRKNSNNMAGPLITNADKVNISNSAIGTQQLPITDPVYAKNQLSIENSEIYQNIQNNIADNQEGNAPVGTDEGMTNVSNSTINTMKTGNVSKMNDLYSGSLYIKDAQSDVTIDGNQLIDLSNGSVNIKTTAYDQGTVSHPAKNARRNYVLLEEGDVTQTVPNLTVTSMAANTTIEVRRPSGKNANTSDTVTAGSLKTATDMNLILKGNLTLTGTAQITDVLGKEIKVTSNDASNTLKITGNAFTQNTGSYTQTGGKLESKSDIGNGKLNVNLENTQVDAKNLYAKNLTLNSSKVAASENVGSKPESSDNAENVTKVSINNSTVNAKQIGALGTYDQTFTIVETDSQSTLTGTVIKDEYRITYDKNGATFNTNALPKVLRTSITFNNSQSSGQSTIKPDNGVVTNPSEDTNHLFSGWYVNEEDAGKTVRKALKVNGTLPGITKATTLKADTISKVIARNVTANADGTKTLTVHAWLNAEGKVVIEKGRKFVKTSETTTKITTQANGAWTAQLTSTGTFIDGRDYQVEFSNVLPEGTKLTLTIPKTSQSAGKYYYYDVSDNQTTTVRFSEFKEMGTSRTFKSETYASGEIPENEVYLLSADYAQTDHSVVQDQKMTFKLISENTSNLEIGNDVTYSLSSVSAGEISVAGKKVTISKLPTDYDNLGNQKLYVKAVFKKNNTNKGEAVIPFNINATLGTNKGKRISQDTVIFKLGTYGSVKTQNQTYNFEGLTPSDYKIIWSLVYGDGSSNNIVGNIVSNEAEAVNE